MKKILITMLSALLFFTSCKKYLDEAYANPNLPTSVPPEQVLQSCINNMHRGIAFDARALGFYIQHYSNIATNPYQPERHGYTPGSDLYGDIWRSHYWSMGFNIIDMIQQGRTSGKFDYVGAAYALNAFSWVTTADVHGDLIVNQAFDRDRVIFDYNPQFVAYDRALKECDSAIFYLDKALLMPSSTLSIGDQYFLNGDINKWKKFAYGMKAKIYRRYQNKPNYATKEADSVVKYCDLSMSSYQDDAMVRFNLAFPDISAKNIQGPLRNNFGGFRPSNFFANLMNGTLFGNTKQDPRLRYMFRPSGDGTFNGIETARHTDNATTPLDKRVPSLWGTVAQTTSPALGVDTGARTFFRNDAPFPLMTYSEMQFIKAEALHIKGDLTSAKTAYVNGIRAHIDMLNNRFTGYLQSLGVNSPTVFNNVQMSATAIADYLADPAIVPAVITRRDIMCQKQIALWGWGYVEAWVDMRLYNYDNINIYPGYVQLTGANIYINNNGKLAYRVRPRYNSEYIYNIDALNSVGGLLDDYHTKKVWFVEP